VAAGGAADVERAAQAAYRAFTEGPWPGLAARTRARVLNRIADAIERRGGRIAELETFDTGLPVTQARGQAARAAENFRFFADMIVTLNEDAFRTGTAQLGYVLRKPGGPAGLITPWNTPFMLETWKLAPALAAGYPVILKPAEWSPLSASLLPEIMTEAGVPDGVFNMVHGIGEAAGAALVTHPLVPRISFTGETSTGQAIMAAAAPGLKGLSMELGGKSPCIVFADADLDAATDSALFGVFSLNGERCTAGSRILAERGIYDALVRRLAERAGRIRVGAPSDPATEVGALIHPDHYDRVLSYVRSGLDEGARLVAGGQRPAHLAACTTWASSHTSPTTCCAPATSSDPCTRRDTSSAAPGATGCPTPSTSTCAIRTATGSRSTPATTTPAIPVIRSCGGTFPIRAAVISTATRSSRPGNAEATTVLDLDGNPRPAAEQHQLLESAVGADGFRVR
jgi:5-carboxymethyl-2-hydroxymuconic-semialdehyde dehydrogenase